MIELNEPEYVDPNQYRRGWDCYGKISKPDATYHVRLNYGMEAPRWLPFLRTKARLEVWKNVWPAIGGLMGRQEYKSNAEARAEFEKVVKMFQEER